MVVKPRSRVGFGGACSDFPDCYAPGTVFMAIHRRAYVGLVGIEGGRLNVAGATEADYLRACGGPAGCVQDVLRSSDLPPLGGLGQVAWQGTPALTQRCLRPAAHRVLVVGDSAGYVEPFSGEGIAWALAAGLRAAPLALRGLQEWTPAIQNDWLDLQQRFVSHRQRICGALAWWLRHPRTVRSVLRLLAVFPQAASPIVRRINAP